MAGFNLSGGSVYAAPYRGQAQFSRGTYQGGAQTAPLNVPTRTWETDPGSAGARPSMPNALNPADVNAYNQAQQSAIGPYAGPLAQAQLQHELDQIKLEYERQNGGRGADQVRAEQALANALMGSEDQFLNSRLGLYGTGHDLAQQLLGNQQSDFERALAMERWKQNSDATARGAYTSVGNNLFNQDFTNQLGLGQERFGIQRGQATNQYDLQRNSILQQLAQNDVQRQYGNPLYDLRASSQDMQSQLQQRLLEAAQAGDWQQILSIESQMAGAQAAVPPPPGDTGAPSMRLNDLLSRALVAPRT